MAPNNDAILSAAPRNEQGVASGMLATARVIGQTVSVAVAGAVFASLGGTAACATLQAQRSVLPLAELAAVQATFASALHGTFSVCAAPAVCGVLTAFVRGDESASTPDAPHRALHGE